MRVAAPRRGETALLLRNFLDGPELGIQSKKIGTIDTMTLDASSRSIMVSEGRFCSEPAPDAISAVAKEVAASVVGKSGTQEGNAAISKLLTSDVSKLFERSQGIQALRDGMYRLCEAYMNRAISAETFEEHMGDLIATLNFIVPIELCSKLNKEIVASIANAELLRSQLPTGTHAPASDSARVADAGNNSGPSGGKKPEVSQKDILTQVLQDSELLSSRFTGTCIEYGAKFAGTMAASSNLRSSAGFQADRIERAQKEGAAASGASGPILNPYKPSP